MRLSRFVSLGPITRITRSTRLALASPLLALGALSAGCAGSDQSLGDLPQGPDASAIDGAANDAGVLPDGAPIPSADSDTCTSGRDRTGCPCTPGDVRTCYGGPAGTEGVGPCKAGSQVCKNPNDPTFTKGAFGPCLGQIVPTSTVTCVADGGAPDEGVDSGSVLPPPESCTSPVVADFRDRIVWHTAIANAYSPMVNIGGHGAADLAGAGDALVATRLESSHLKSAPSYTFAGTTTTEDRLGYLSFADGTPQSLQVWPGPGREFDTFGDNLSVIGLFAGALDIGLGSWTSDPTLYPSSGPPQPIPDLYVAESAVPSGVVETGRHFSVSGVPADPMPGSFRPELNAFGTSVDVAGNTYVIGRFQGTIALDGKSVTFNPPPPYREWAAFVASFTKSGTLRWIDATPARQGRVIATDPSGRYLANIFDGTYTNAESLQLRDTTTGAVLFSHVASAQANLLAVTVDQNGNVAALGEGYATGSLGTLAIAANMNFIASFDKSGGLRWSHDLIPEIWPSYQTIRYALASTDSEVALVLGSNMVSPDAPRRIQIGACPRDVPWRAYASAPETGRTIPWTAKDGPIAFGHDVTDEFLAVLDATTGEYRWSRLIDHNDTSVIGRFNSLSLAIHSSGDVMIALNTDQLQVDYGTGPSPAGLHVFRLRGH